MPGEIPSVACFITVHNDGVFLDESVGSAIDAVEFTRKIRNPVNVSISIFDDGSTDRRTVEVLRRWERFGIQVFRLPHRGLSATRNEAVRRCGTADFFVPLDADNRIRANMIPDLLPILVGNPGAAIAYGDAMRFGLQTGRWGMGPTDLGRLSIQNHIDSCALIRTSAFFEVGGYREQFYGHEDWDLWLRFVAANYSLEYSGTLCFDYRVRNDSMLSLCKQPLYEWVREDVLTRKDGFR